MSTTHELPQPVADPAAEPGTPRPLGRLSTAARLGIGALALAVLGAGIAVAVGRGSTPAPKAGDAIELPATLAGLHPLPPGVDPTRSAGWLDRAKAAGHGATVTGRGYGTGAAGARSIRVVAGRTDLTGALELAWAVGAGEQVGPDHCTNNVRLTPSGSARVRPTVMLCWRTSATFSAYSLVIDPVATTAIPAAEGAAALDAAWATGNAGR